MPEPRLLARVRRLRWSGRAEEAIALTEEAMSELPFDRHWRRRAALLVERALSEIQIGLASAARESLRRVSSFLEESGRTSTVWYATVIDNLGFVEREARALEKASEYHDRAIAIYERLHVPRHLARSLTNAAIAAKDRGMLGKARAFIERAMTVVPENDFDLRGHIFATAALLSQLKQEFEDARRQHLISLIAYRRASDPENEALELHNLAMVEHLRGRPAVAVRLLRRAMALNRRFDLTPGTARDLHTLGLLTFDGGDRQGGLQLLRQAWKALAEVNDLEGMLWCQLDLARIGAAAGTLQESRDLLDRAIARAEGLGDPLLGYQLHLVRGEVREQSGDLSLAIADYETAVTFAETFRAGILDEEDALAFFRPAQLAAYEALIRVSIKVGDTTTAWQACQLAKTRELHRRLRFDTAIRPRGVSDSLRDHERSLMAAYRTLMAEWRARREAGMLPRIEQIEGELGAVWDEMATGDPEYAGLRRSQASPYAAVREILAAGSASALGRSDHFVLG